MCGDKKLKRSEMSNRKRTITVTFETERLLIAGSGQSPRCPICGGNTSLLRLDEAARDAGVSAQSLYREIEAQGVHLTELVDGQSLVCLDSQADSSRPVREEGADDQER